MKDLTEAQKIVVTEQILSTLQRAKFAKWYTEGAFDHWITGDLPTIPDRDIFNAVRNLFNLE